MRWTQKHYPEPIIDMAIRDPDLRHRRQCARHRPSPVENPEWMRWNNYGIGLLDAQQYEASVQAFERVAALRPDYADAYTNMAIVEIPWERYNDARPNLAKALALLPGDPRALYYRALVERNAGQVKEAIADFEAVLAKYPRSKDATARAGLQLLPAARLCRGAHATSGYRPSIPTTSPLTTRWPSFTAVWAKSRNPPSSPPSSPTRRTIPPASVYALEFLRKHPEVAAESVAWHTHDLTGDPGKHPAKIEYQYIPGAGR